MAPGTRAALATTLIISVWAVADEPYKRMLDDTLVFTGTETLPPESGVAGEIVVGLFAPDDAAHPVGRAITRGAMLAVDQANAEGGIDGRPIRLVRRWADDPWGAGANEVVRLVFEDRAWAIIGGPDGASTHVAQQVATKAHIPLIAPVSSDPSLTRTRVPWIFRLAPDDTSQAALLVNSGILPRGLERIGLVTSTDHDGRTAAAELAAALEEHGRPPAFHFEITTRNDDFSAIARRAADFSPDGLILRVPRTDLRPLCDALRKQGLDVPVVLPWIPGVLPGRYALPYSGEVFWLEPFSRSRSCGPALKLERAFIARFGERPTPSAVYGHDAVRMVVEGLMTEPEGRVTLRSAIAALTGFPGASGVILWDQGGGNAAAAPLYNTACSVSAEARRIP